MHQILLVEDNEELMESLTNHLLETGFKVCATDAMDKGLELFKNNKIDLVITDFHIQQGSGLRLLHKLRKLDTSVPVFLITGTPFVSEEDFLVYKFSKVFLKPFSTSALISEMKKHLALKP